LLTNIMRTREYLLTGERIPAATAVELGLATRTTEPEDLRNEDRRVAGRLAAQPPLAVRGTKQVLNMHLSRALAGAVQAGFAAEEVSMQSDEHQQRMAALRPRQE
jgi:enoyl-CoA hydratase